MAEHSHRWRPSPFLVASAGLHGLALGTAIVSPSLWSTALAAVAGNHLAIGAASMLPRGAWLGPNLSRLPAGRAGSNLMALTFDDGPDPIVTPAVLALLEEAGMQATFFCIGERAAAYPDVISAIREGGHGVANHTYSHLNSFALRGPRRMQREVVQAQEAIARSGGGVPRYFRAPAGMQNPWLAVILASAGLSLVSWTRRGFDTVSRDGVRVASRLTRGLGAGDILLLHDGNPALTVKGTPVVLEALPKVLDAMQQRGLRSEPLHRLLGAAASP